MKRMIARLVEHVARAAGCELVPRWRLRNLALATHLQALFALLNVDCVLDVGANRGQYGTFLRQEVGYTGHIASFEPQPACLRDLEAKASRDPLWKIYGFALGSESGQALLNVMRTSEFTSFLSPDSSIVPMFAERNTVVRVETVPVKRLDDVIGEVRAASSCRSVYLKLDTQGYDLEVIKGASATLESIAALQTEVSVLPIYGRMPDWLSSFHTLKEHGFDVTGLFPVGESEDAQLRVVELDCVAVNTTFRRRPGVE
jgi:FkbM family methyltransferase